MYYFKDPLNPSPNMYDNARIIANSQLNERRVDPDEFKGKSLGALLKNAGNWDISPVDQQKFALKRVGKRKLDLSGMGKLDAPDRDKIDLPMVGKGAQNNQTDGETDEDIIGMRQTAADQGGIPQDLVNEPIERTKQLPDGRTMRSTTVQPPKVTPNIGGAGPMIPPKLPPTPQKNSINKLIFNNFPSRGEPEIPDYENIIRTVEKYPTRMSSTKSKSGFYTQ